MLGAMAARWKPLCHAGLSAGHAWQPGRQPDDSRKGSVAATRHAQGRKAVVSSNAHKKMSSRVFQNPPRCPSPIRHRSFHRREPRVARRVRSQSDKVVSTFRFQGAVARGEVNPKRGATARPNGEPRPQSCKDSEKGVYMVIDRLGVPNKKALAALKEAKRKFDELYRPLEEVVRLVNEATRRGGSSRPGTASLQERKRSGPP
jgi:hypothetical protein